MHCVKHFCYTPLSDNTQEFLENSSVFTEMEMDWMYMAKKETGK